MNGNNRWLAVLSNRLGLYPAGRTASSRIPMVVDVRTQLSGTGSKRLTAVFIDVERRSGSRSGRRTPSRPPRRPNPRPGRWPPRGSRASGPWPSEGAPLPSRRPPRWARSPASRAAGTRASILEPPPAPSPFRPCGRRGCPALQPAPQKARAPKPSRRRSRRPPWSSIRPPSWLAPSPRASCSPAASCSCRGCAARGRRPSRPWSPWPEAGSWKCASHTRPRTPKGVGLASLSPRASFCAPPRRVRRPGGTFFERQTQALEGAAHAGRRDRHAVLVVEELAVLLQCEVGVARDLSGQRLLQHPTLPGGWPRHGPGFHVSRLPAQPQVAPDGRRRHAEDPHDLRPGHPAVDGRKHLRSKILRVRFHAAKSRTPLNLYANRCQKQEVIGISAKLLQTCREC